jgi:hypothetical protein
MSYDQFEERWAQQAKKEYESYEARPVEELVADIRAGRFGSHYQIWRSLGQRGSLADAGAVLADVLESSADFLNRYHCAEALLLLVGSDADGLRAEHLSGREKFPVKERLAELRKKLRI